MKRKHYLGTLLFTLLAAACSSPYGLEGEEGACEPLEPRLSFWRFDGKRLVFYIGDEVLEDAEVVWLDAQRVRLDLVVDLAQNSEDQTHAVWSPKFRSYQILRRVN